MPVAFIPSPLRSVWHVGPLPVRGQALCVVAGILVAVWLTDRRYRNVGGQPGAVVNVAAWAVTAGLIPGAIGLLLAGTKSWFGTQTGLWHALRVADDVLGFPGAIACGLAGAWLAARPRKRAIGPPQVPLLAAAAPALLVGHAIATLGSWVGQQGYGRPSSLWWAVRISPDHRLPGFENYATFQPVFLYQTLWDLVAAIAVIAAARRFSLSGPRAFALAGAAYGAGGIVLGLLRMGQLPVVWGIRAGELGDAALLVAAVGYLLRTHGTQRAHASLRPLETDSSGDVIST